MVSLSLSHTHTHYPSHAHALTSVEPAKKMRPCPCYRLSLETLALLFGKKDRFWESSVQSLSVSLSHLLYSLPCSVRCYNMFDKVVNKWRHIGKLNGLFSSTSERSVQWLIAIVADFIFDTHITFPSPAHLLYFYNIILRRIYLLGFCSADQQFSLLWYVRKWIGHAAYICGFW